MLLLVFMLGMLDSIYASRAGFQGFSCANNNDCQLNGKCLTSADTLSPGETVGSCACDPGWTGDQCELLDLLPAKVDNGLQDSFYGSWGGSVLQNTTDGTWHMYAAVIEQGCGLSAWRPNSALGHATSSSPDGPFKFQGFIRQHFAHEPVAVMGPDGEILIFYMGASSGETGPGANYATDCTSTKPLKNLPKTYASTKITSLKNYIKLTHVVKVLTSVQDLTISGSLELHFTAPLLSYHLNPLKDPGKWSVE